MTMTSLDSLTLAASETAPVQSWEEIQAERTARNLAPKIGDGATFTMWSDSYACTVVAVSKSGHKISVQRDKATLLNGMTSGEADALTATQGGFVHHVEGVQRYTYTPNADGTIYVCTLRTRKNGEKVWKQVGTGTCQTGGTVYVGERSEHYDHNF
jgi:hypothetical protein